MSTLTKREEFAVIILAGLTNQLNMSEKGISGMSSNVSNKQLIDKAIELTDELINKLNEPRPDSGPIQIFS